MADPPTLLEPPTARGRRRTTPDGEGLEKALDLSAWILLIIGGSATLVLGIRAATTSESGWPLLAMSWQLFVVVVLFLLLCAVAEIIRLQKRIAGVPYTGMISGSGTREEVRCSECGGVLIDSQRCDFCLRPIDGIDDVDEGPASAP